MLIMSFPFVCSNDSIPRVVDFARVPRFTADDTAMKKQQREKNLSLVLRQSADLLPHRGVYEEIVEFQLRHLRRMVNVVKMDESLDPGQ